MRSLRILVVDDLPTNVKLLQAQLEGEGHAVSVAFNGVEGLEVLERETIDVIVSDVLMPEMDGYQFCYAVRQDKRLAHLPFIFHAATYTSPADERLAINLGGDAFLRKPASVHDVLQAIERAVSSQRAKPLVQPPNEELLGRYNKELVTKLQERNIEAMAAASQISLQTTALETAADAILITDVRGVILWVNPAFTTLTGYAREEAIGRTPRILKSGVHDKTFYRQFWDTIASGKVWRGEFTNRHKNGSLYYGQHTVRSARGPDGSITHFVGVMHDVTDRKRAEEELRQAHAQLSQLLEHSPAVIYALAVEGERITPRLVSENVTQLLGFSVPEALSHEWWLGRLHPDDRELAIASNAETLARGESRTEYRLAHKDGSYRWVDDNRRLVRNDKGEPAKLVGVWTDITERRRVEAALSAAERRYHDIIEFAPVGIYQATRDGRLLMANEMLARMLGFQSIDALTATPIRDRWVDYDEHLRFISRIPPGQSALAEGNMRRQDGSEIQILKVVHAVRNEQGEVLYDEAFLSDVTELKVSQEQARLLQRSFDKAKRVDSLGRVAATAAHEFNNVLMGIQPFAETILRRASHDPNLGKAATSIINSVKRGKGVTAAILRFANPSAPRLQVIQAGPWLAALEPELRQLAGSACRLEVELPDGSLSFAADPQQLEQVLSNLVVNARQAMNGGGTIRLRCATAGADTEFSFGKLDDQDTFVQLSVTDDGSGIPDDILGNVFEPLFTTKRTGTGLGLSVAAQLIEQHGGRIGVETSVGKGTTFHVLLPGTTAGRLPGAVPAPALVRRLPRRLLLVEDESAIAEGLAWLLRLDGIEVTVAGTGGEVAAAVHQGDPDVVVLDFGLPDMDGAVVYSMLHERWPRLPVIVSSGHARPPQEEWGPALHLQKPYPYEALVRILGSALETKEAAVLPGTTASQTVSAF